MTETERVALARRRSAALDAWLQEQAELFLPVDGECEDEDATVEGPAIITGAVLCIRTRDCGEAEYVLDVCAPYALGMSERLGLAHRLVAHFQ